MAEQVGDPAMAAPQVGDLLEVEDEDRGWLTRFVVHEQSGDDKSCQIKMVKVDEVDYIIPDPQGGGGDEVIVVRNTDGSWKLPDEFRRAPASVVVSPQEKGMAIVWANAFEYLGKCPHAAIQTQTLPGPDGEWRIRPETVRSDTRITQFIRFVSPKNVTFKTLDKIVDHLFAEGSDLHKQALDRLKPREPEAADSPLLALPPASPDSPPPAVDGLLPGSLDAPATAADAPLSASLSASSDMPTAAADEQLLALPPPASPDTWLQVFSPPVTPDTAPAQPTAGQDSAAVKIQQAWLRAKPWLALKQLNREAKPLDAHIQKLEQPALARNSERQPDERPKMWVERMLNTATELGRGVREMQLDYGSGEQMLVLTRTLCNNLTKAAQESVDELTRDIDECRTQKKAQKKAHGILAEAQTKLLGESEGAATQLSQDIERLQMRLLTNEKIPTASALLRLGKRKRLTEAQTVQMGDKLEDKEAKFLHAVASRTARLERDAKNCAEYLPAALSSFVATSSEGLRQADAKVRKAEETFKKALQEHHGYMHTKLAQTETSALQKVFDDSVSYAEARYAELADVARKMSELAESGCLNDLASVLDPKMRGRLCDQLMAFSQGCNPQLPCLADLGKKAEALVQGLECAGLAEPSAPQSTAGTKVSRASGWGRFPAWVSRFLGSSRNPIVL